MIDTLFLLSAVLGGGVFLVRTLMQLIGVGGDHDAGGGGVEPADVGDVDDVHPDADSGFRVLSLQGVASFLMMFGLVGLALTRQSHVGPAISIAAAAAAGMICVGVIGRIFATMGKLQSDGTMKLTSAVGQEGVVYLTIPEEGIGKVQVEVQGRLGVWDAQASSAAAIPTGKRVRVVQVRAEKLVVEPVQ